MRKKRNFDGLTYVFEVKQLNGISENTARPNGSGKWLMVTYKLEIHITIPDYDTHAIVSVSQMTKSSSSSNKFQLLEYEHNKNIYDYQCS